MIEITLTDGCSKCHSVIDLLKEKGIEHSKKLLNELNDEEADCLILEAREMGIRSFPIVKRDGKMIKFSDLEQLEKTLLGECL